jgi:ATP-dependent Zn protease
MKVEHERRRRKTLAKTAYHEAGHAVASYYLFHRIKKVTIVPDKKNDNAGSCHSKGPSLAGIDVSISPRKQATIFDNIKIFLAGEAAQARFNRRTIRQWHGSSDFHQAAGLALRLSGDARGAELLLDWLRHEAEQLVAIRWREIEVVAEALLRRRTLTGEEVRAVINEYYDARIHIPHCYMKGSECPA